MIFKSLNPTYLVFFKFGNLGGRCGSFTTHNNGDDIVETLSHPLLCQELFRKDDDDDNQSLPALQLVINEEKSSGGSGRNVSLFFIEGQDQTLERSFLK
jgi:hypothetical protein